MGGAGMMLFFSSLENFRLDAYGASAHLSTLGKALGWKEGRSGTGSVTVLWVAFHARSTISEENSFASARTESVLASSRKW